MGYEPKVRCPNTAHNLANRPKAATKLVSRYTRTWVVGPGGTSSKQVLKTDSNRTNASEMWIARAGEEP